jgi:hypothetical protein
LINNISNKNAIIISENFGGSLAYNGKGELFSQEIERGNYLLEMSGYFTCLTLTKHDLAFIIETGGDSLTVDTTLHTNSSYGYPYSIRKELTLNQDSKVKVTLSHKQNQTFNLYNSILSLSPMVKIM